MTDNLDSQSRKDLISYKFDKAAQTIGEADVLASANYYNAAVNRLYYAAYYAASALMLHNSLEAVTHKGIKTMLSLKFVLTGLLPQDYGRIYQRLFDCRQAGDYDDFVYYDKETFEELRPQAIEFIEMISNFIRQTTE